MSEDDMKKFTMILLCVLLGAPTMFAQYEEEEDLPPIPPKRGAGAKVGALAGAVPGWLFLDVKPLNRFIVDASGAPLKDQGVFMMGGAGAAYILILPNFRVGGMWTAGGLKSTAVEVFSGGQRFRRDAELDVGFGGVTLEYVVPIVERLDVAVGAVLGGGGLDLTLRRNNGNPFLWEEVFRNIGSSPSVGVENYSVSMSGSFFVWVPSVNIEYAILGWLGVRAGVSYVGMSAPSWEVDNKYDLLGVPSDINGQGLMLNLGLFVGTF